MLRFPGKAEDVGTTTAPSLPNRADSPAGKRDSLSIGQQHPISAQASVRVLRTLPELEGIRRDWESWPGYRDSEMESYLTFLRSNPGTVRPHIVVVYRGGRPDAILVGRIDRGHISCRIGYLNLNLPARILCFVYGALRGNPSTENCDLLVSSVLQSLSAGEADVAYMDFLRKNSDLYRLATERPGRLSRDYVCVTQPHYAATLPATVKEYYQSLPAVGKGFNKARHKKLLKDHGDGVKIRCFREVAELDTLVEDAEQVARTSYQRGLGVGFADTPSVRNHLRLKAERSRLRGYVLYLEGKPCAFWIGEVNQGTFGSDSLAYDAAFGKYSPGMFLICKVIEGFCEDTGEKVTAIDFGAGHAQYKQVLSNQCWTETCVCIFAPTFKAIFLNITRSLVMGMDQTIKRALARTNLLQKIKKAWRDQAKPKGAPPAEV
jgi:GNAT acetyltransferase-like protein